jgi:hypothetical protein
MPAVVKNYRNSFIEVFNDQIRILMNPWVSTANFGLGRPLKEKINIYLIL